MSNAWILEPLGMGTITASHTETGFDAPNVANDYFGIVWKSTAAATDPYIDMDLGADTVIDTIIVLGATGALASWNLRVEAATEAQGTGVFPGGGVYDSGEIDFLAGANFPPSGRGVALWSAPIASPPAAARYWRIHARDIGGSLPAIFGRVLIGRRIELDRNFQFGRAHGVKDLGGYDFSRRGVPLPKTGAKLRSVGLTFGAAYKDEAETYILPLIEEVAGQTPIAICTDPDADANRQRRIHYGPLVGDLGLVERRADRWEWRANLVDLG